MNTVSICIPTYNGAAFIQEALESVRQQTYPNIEVIVSDDASTDNTLEIVNVFKTEVDFPFTILSHIPQGIGANWNNCIAHAKGEYIKFLFQDDILLPNCIERMVSMARSGDNVGMVYCRRTIIYDAENPYDCRWVNNFKTLHQSWKSLKVTEGIKSGKEYIKDLNLLKPPVNKIGEPPAVLLHSNCFKKIGYFNIHLKQALDIEYWYRVLPHFNIGFVDEPLVKFRLHGNQASQINAKSGHTDRNILPTLQFKSLFWYLPKKIKMELLNEIWFYSKPGTFFRKVTKKLNYIK